MFNNINIEIYNLEQEVNLLEKDYIFVFKYLCISLLQLNR